MKLRVSPSLLVALGSVLATALFATLFIRSELAQKADRTMLRALLEREAAVSSRRFFKADYNPADAHLADQTEITAFLEDRRVRLEALPAELQQALKERQAVGLLVNEVSDGPGEPRRLSPRARMLLAWEQSVGTGMLWLNGSGGGGGSCSEQEKCLDYDNTCCSMNENWCIGCVGFYRCPPCKPCNRCEWDKPVSLK